MFLPWMGGCQHGPSHRSPSHAVYAQCELQTSCDTLERPFPPADLCDDLVRPFNK